MELNREQIIKALECCVKVGGYRDAQYCNDCPLHKERCAPLLPQNALALIKELTEENEGLYRLVDEKIQEKATLTEEAVGWKEMAEGYQKMFEDCHDEKERYKRYYFNHCFDELRANVEADVRADTVREMQEVES